MSHECFAYAKMLDREEVHDPATRLLLLVVAEYTRNKTGRCYEDRAQLAHDCRCSTKTVYRKLKSLETASPPIIKLYPRFRADGSRRSDEIEIVGFRSWLRKNDPKAPDPDKPAAPDDEAPDGADDAPGVPPSRGEKTDDPKAEDGTPPGQSVMAPPQDNLSIPPPGQDVPTPGHSSVHTPGQQVSTYKENPPLPDLEELSLSGEEQEAQRARERVRKKFGLMICDLWDEQPEFRYVVELFIGPLSRATKRASGIENYPAFLAEIRDGLGAKDYDLATLERAAQLAADDRVAMPARPQCLAYCERAKTDLALERQSAALRRQSEAMNAADAAMAARTQSLHERLRTRMGKAAFDAWFASLHVSRVTGQTLDVTVIAPMVRNWINNNFSEVLAECAAAEFPGVDRVNIELRKPPRAA